MFLHKGGKYDIKTDSFIGDVHIIKQMVIPNLIVSNASILMAMRMAPGIKGKVHSEELDEQSYVNYGLGYLAIGTGTESLALPTVSRLKNEVARKKFASWSFIDPVGGQSTDSPTNILKLTTVFEEDGHEGTSSLPISEMGLFGGMSSIDGNDVGIDEKDGGIMFNYKVFDVWNKPYDSTLTINWKITF